jgi:hypothetical protein
MVGRLWVFYSDGSDAVYRTSVDGLAWSPPTRVRAGSNLGHRMGYWFDGTFVHYAHCDAQPGESVTYRRGTPTRDGAIHWSTEQVAYVVPASNNVMYPKVITDALGRPFIAFMIYDGGFNQAPYDAVVTASSRSDGSWQTATGFPYVLVRDNTTAYPDPVGAPLASGGTFWVYNKNLPDDTYYGRPWDGEAWGPEERVTEWHARDGLYNLVADGDDLHLSFAGGIVRYRRRDHRAGWGEELIVTGGGRGHTAITLVAPGDVIISWLSDVNDTIVSRELVGGALRDPVVLVDESARGLADPQRGINLNGLVSAGRFRSAVAYTTGSSPPYELKFVGLP